MKEKRKFVVVLVQESRHIMRSCLWEQGSIFPAERDHLEMCAMKEDVLFILDIRTNTVSECGAPNWLQWGLTFSQ
eukprot:437699-Pelagomonas_calceolata.AAC.1